jgi:SAM-dependent methyltransferase
MTTKDDYERYLRERHRPNHARRTAERWASFFTPHLRPGMRVLDLGCGPCSITKDLGDSIGVDLEPESMGGVPVVSADAARLPFPDASFDAIFSNALLQHVPDAQAVVNEARRVARPGAVIGLGDADWDGVLMAPHDPLLDRGQELQEALRSGGNPRIGRHLRGMLANAGFEGAQAWVEAPAEASTEATSMMAWFQATLFEAPAAIAHLTALGLSDAEECAAIAGAWKHWGSDPGAFATRFWITALAYAPT